MAALHHRPEMDDMRSAFDAASYKSDHDADRISHNASRSGSDKSYRTAATEYSQPSMKRPARIHYPTCDGEKESTEQYFVDRHPLQSPRASLESLASTVASEEDVQEEQLVADFEIPAYTQQPDRPEAIAATPADFSDLFPSHRRLVIRHDDSTVDGNMNLRVDTEVSVRGQRRDMTLFHLRMHDLREREFSLRRYCRDSGREVCHSTRRFDKSSASQRPGLQRSLSNALNTLRSKSDSRSPTVSSLKRNDSGYGSLNSAADTDRDDRASSTGSTPKPQSSAMQNSIKLEFSNYAQVEVRRTGVRGSKRYEFEYWGISYAWRRGIYKDASGTSVSFSLTRSGTDRALAHIVTCALSPSQVEDEQRRGGWIPPCFMRLESDNIIRGQKDVADVVVAAGLIALVDNSIKTHFSSRQRIEYVGPKRLLSEIFKRETKSQQSHQSSHDQDSRPSSRGTATTSLRTPARAVSNVI